MKDKVIWHAGSLLGGMVHNLNTPLMWVMGRSQLMEARNENMQPGMSDDQVVKAQEKNAKDLRSIAEGAEKIDYILKGIGYKIQMANEGMTSVELKDYLMHETNFMMGDMRFKHETDTEFDFENSPARYVRVDYNALSWAVVGSINVILENTEKGRSLRVALDNGVIAISSPQLQLDGAVRASLEEACAGLEGAAVVSITPEGVRITVNDL